MALLLQLLIIGVSLVTFSSCAPWQSNNNIREFDLEWQCQQFCNRLKGKLDYNSSESSCTCTVNSKYTLDFDSKHLENKLKDLGFNFKIIDGRKNSIVKRDLIGDLIKKKLDKGEQEDNEIVADANPKPEEHPVIPISERLHRLRTKLLVPKIGKDSIITPDNDNVDKGTPIVESTHKEDDNQKNEELAKSKVPKLKLNVLKNDSPAPDLSDNTITRKIPKIHLRSNVKKTPLAKAEESDSDDNSKQSKTESNRFPHLSIHKRIHIADNHESRNDRIKELRERIRLRLESRRAKYAAHKNGHTEEDE